MENIALFPVFVFFMTSVFFGTIRHSADLSSTNPSDFH